MNNTLTFHLTNEDIANSCFYGTGNQLLCLLASHTGTLWQLTPEGSALEIMAPYRTARFQVEVNGVWQTYQEGAPLAPRVQAELVPLESSVEHQLTTALRGLSDEFARFASPIKTHLQDSD